MRENLQAPSICLAACGAAAARRIAAPLAAATGKQVL
jgi:hypothetical protein